MSPAVTLYRTEREKYAAKMEALFAEIRPLLPPSSSSTKRTKPRVVGTIRKRVRTEWDKQYDRDYYARNKEAVRERQNKQRRKAA
jgi:hypothetical protein